MEKYGKIVIILLLMVFTASHIDAMEARTITGKVTDSNGAPIENVLIIGDEGDVFTYSDKEGNFTISTILSDIILLEKEGFVSSQTQVMANNEIVNIILEKPEYLMGSKDMIQLPFRKLAFKRNTGAVKKLDVSEIRKYDTRQGLGAIIAGRVPGLMGSKNIWGRGNAIIVVDGVPRPEGFNVYVNEIEDITVLKDAVSRALYGSMADAGVIMVTTKRGKAYKKELNFQAEYQISQPIEHTMPKYMNAADYMETINTLDPLQPTYSQKKIDDTRNGINPAFNPDLDLYSDEFLYSSTPYRNIFGEASGGNKSAQYYLNLGWQNSEGWIKADEREKTNMFNLRGNVDYQISSNFKMSMDAVAMLAYNTGPNISDYWETATTVLPNAYPLYWDPAILSDEARTELMKVAKLLPNGMLPGGNSTYQTNFYNDIYKKGDRVNNARNFQVNIGAEWDLKKLLPGLKAKGYLALDAFNTLTKEQSGKYAAYEPKLLTKKFEPTVDSIGYVKYDNDVQVSNFAPVEDESLYFHRRIGAFGALTYDKSFGKTDVSLVGSAYRDQLAISLQFQESRNLTFGFSGNIMHNKKYILDYSLALLGSQKLLKEDRFAFAPAVGLAWIASEEAFLSESNTIDFLKIRANAGIMKNDNWDNYWYHTSAFQEGDQFQYNNGITTTRDRQVTNFASDISWQKRKELSIGFDAAFLNKKLWVEGEFFYTERYDNIVELTNTVPSLLGNNQNAIFGNFDSDRIQGFDLGVNYNTEITNDLQVNVGLNLISKSEKVLAINEPKYADAYKQKVGTATNSLWGLASDGLYSVNDFDANGVLLSTLPTPGWGTVAPGDIKYKDWNGDKEINSDDEHIIGRSGADFAYSINLNIKYKQFELMAIGTSYLGGNANRSGSYYRTFGKNMKYPEHLKEAYSTSNQNVNALYPRLTSTNNSNNFRASDFWMYNDNSFSIPTIQLTYSYKGKSNGAIKGAKVYFRGTNLVSISKYPEYANLSLGSPLTRGFTIGTTFNF